MRNVKDEQGRDVRGQKERKVRFNSLLCLAIQFTGRRMYTKKVNIQRMEETQMNKWECCERELGRHVGYVNRTWR